jgi:hypothetical protein
MYGAKFSWPRQQLMGDQLHFSVALTPNKSPRYELDNAWADHHSGCGRRGGKKLKKKHSLATLTGKSGSLSISYVSLSFILRLSSIVLRMTTLSHNHRLTQLAQLYTKDTVEKKGLGLYIKKKWNSPVTSVVVHTCASCEVRSSTYKKVKLSP